MAAWNDTFDASTDWSAYAFASMFYSAVNERLTALGLTTLTAPSSGADCQSASFWSNLQSKAELLATGFTRLYDGMPATTNQTDGFQETFTPTGNYTLATWRSTAGIGSGGFRRKRPREITSLTATVDTQGNARAAGQVAWLTSSLSPGPYTFDGTAWTLTPTADPDVLDSAAGTLSAGTAVAGDYMGPWILTELRDGLNLLDMKGLTGASFLGGASTYAQGGSYDPSGNPITTWADAQGSAESWWSTSPLHGASDNGNGVYSEGVYAINPPPSPNTYGAGLRRDKWSFTLSDSGAVSKRYELYAVPVRIPLLSTDGGSGTVNPNLKYTFYNEDGWARATYNRAYTGTYGTATSASITGLPTGTGKPAWCDSPDSTLRGQYKGSGFYWYAAIRYNFAYNKFT